MNCAGMRAVLVSVTILVSSQSTAMSRVHLEGESWAVSKNKKGWPTAN